MPNPTARDLIRAAAVENGWSSDGTSNYHDRFIRAVDPASLSPDLARVYAVVDHSPSELIVAHYDELGRVSGLATSTPGQQSATTGDHYPTGYVCGGKRSATLAMLAIGVVNYRISLNAAHGITEVVA